MILAHKACSAAGWRDNTSRVARGHLGDLEGSIGGFFTWLNLLNRNQKTSELFCNPTDDICLWLKANKNKPPRSGMPRSSDVFSSCSLPITFHPACRHLLHSVEPLGMKSSPWAKIRFLISSASRPCDRAWCWLRLIRQDAYRSSDENNVHPLGAVNLWLITLAGIIEKSTHSELALFTNHFTWSEHHWHHVYHFRDV